MNDGGAEWLVIILENSEASELALPLPLALFSFSPLRGLFLICSFPSRHTQTRAGGLQTASVWSWRAGEPALGDNGPGGGLCSSFQRLDLGGVAAYTLVIVRAFLFCLVLFLIRFSKDLPYVIAE